MPETESGLFIQENKGYDRGCSRCPSLVHGKRYENKNRPNIFLNQDISKGRNLYLPVIKHKEWKGCGKKVSMAVLHIVTTG
jgi:hypothetical protein